MTLTGIEDKKLSFTNIVIYQIDNDENFFMNSEIFYRVKILV